MTIPNLPRPLNDYSESESCQGTLPELTALLGTSHAKQSRVRNESFLTSTRWGNGEHSR
jgi:hypothetical protein